MITRENIIHFYTKYKENLKTEDQIQENLLKAEDQEAWIENLKNKSRMMRRLGLFTSERSRAASSGVFSV